MRDRLVPVLLSVAIIVVVAVVQERSRHLGALIATMPLTAPLATWIVFSASFVFVLVCWLGYQREWGFPVSLAAAAAA